MSWLDQYPKALQALTLEQVNAAVKKYVDPGKMVLIKSGTVGPLTPTSEKPRKALR